MTSNNESQQSSHLPEELCSENESPQVQQNVQIKNSGLHQLNFDPNKPLQYQNKSANRENAIVSAFSSFKRKLRSLAGKNEVENLVDELSALYLEEDLEEEKKPSLNSLPFYCKVYILSMLETNDICCLSQTSWHWNEICSDTFVWRELLCRDAVKWTSVCYKSYPLLKDDIIFEMSNNQSVSKGFVPINTMTFEERVRCRESGFDYKQLYLTAAQHRFKHNKEVKTSQFPSTSASHYSIPKLLRSVWATFIGCGQVIMLGPGMESKNTSKLFICLLRSRPDLFVIKGLLPGGQEGIGSGVELEFRGERRFNLIALYSNNRQARRDQVGLSRLLNSRILDVRLPNSEGSATTVFQDAFDNFVCVEHNFVLSSAVKNFLSGGQVGRRCLVYAVDASKEGQNVIDISTNRLELKTFLDGLQETELLKTPLLVICCHSSLSKGKIPCCEIASYLDLASITDRPWLVRDVNVDSLDGLESGLSWLFEQ